VQPKLQNGHTQRFSLWNIQRHVGFLSVVGLQSSSVDLGKENTHLECSRKYIDGFGEVRF